MQIMKNQENVQLFWQPKEEKTVFLRLFCTSDSLKNLQSYSNVGKTKLKDVIGNTGEVVWKLTFNGKLLTSLKNYHEVLWQLKSFSINYNSPSDNLITSSMLMVLL